ncbi:MAG TPA: TonB-dependent receptor [Chthoniobacterales bacterium]
MIVSSQRSIIEESVSIDEWSGDDVRLRGIEKLEDLQSRAPNMVARSGGARSLNQVLGFRGMVNNPLYGEPAVALYVDDVPYASTFSYDTSLLDIDIDHVEIYRGPQFTRWGRRGAMGLISIQSIQPGDRLGVRAEASYASHDEQSVKMRLDGPLAPGLGFTLSGGYSRRDGYLDNDLLNISPDQQEAFVGRFSLLWRPTGALEIQIIASTQRYDDGVQRYTNLDSTPETIEHDFSGVTKGHSDVQSARIRYTSDGLMFTSITARRGFRLDPASFDLDFSPLPFLVASVVADQVQYSQEFRLQPSHESAALDWFAGAYASWTQLDLRVDDNIFHGDTDFNDKTVALFGEITRKFDSGVELTLGLRGELVEKSADRSLRNPDGSIGRRNRHRTDSSLSPKLTVAKRIGASLLVYASSAISSRPGSYSAFNFNPELNSADSEQTWANEIGAKASLLDDRLEISLTGFWYEINDYQIERYVLSGFGIFTADKVSSRGVELEILSHPVQGLELSAAVGYVNARFQDYHDPSTGVDLAGRHPPYIPDFTANFSAQYRHPSGLIARVEWLLTGRAFFDDSNSASGAQNAYGILNARIGFEEKHWSVYLYGKNLASAEYYTLKLPTLGVGITGEPQSIGAMVALNF